MYVEYVWFEHGYMFDHWRDPLGNASQEGNPAEPPSVKDMKDPSCSGILR